MSYSIVNLAAAEDRAAGFGMADIQEIRFPREALGAEGTGLALHRIHPGRRQAFGHRHRQAEEICVVLSGSGKVVLDGEVHDLVTLDAVRIAPPVLRAFEAGPDGMELLVFGPHHESDGERVPEGFWPE
ncbi:cupin domain-containing protein [Conexibacter sp. DBS9H8]|uniref:cupin domain-containing protein n=1 Tax=Conexibacter sp. DBS9H8 TaxID=2937801 RepID=UPI00200D540F|nr:cupin domain-containing protein [Conexibacter sp. DBS9H8]